MTLELKRIYSPELPQPGDMPADPACARVMVYAEVGLAGATRADTFYFSVCTTAWIERELTHQPAAFGHGRLIVRTFDWDVVSEAIEKVVRGIEAPSWEQAVGKMRLVASWDREGL